jgi:hypothetical protein
MQLLIIVSDLDGFICFKSTRHSEVYPLINRAGGIRHIKLDFHFLRKINLRSSPMDHILRQFHRVHFIPRFLRSISISCQVRLPLVTDLFLSNEVSQQTFCMLFLLFLFKLHAIRISSQQSAPTVASPHGLKTFDLRFSQR